MSFTFLTKSSCSAPRMIGVGGRTSREASWEGLERTNRLLRTGLHQRGFTTRTGPVLERCGGLEIQNVIETATQKQIDGTAHRAFGLVDGN